MSDLDVGRLSDGDADGDTGGGIQRSCLDQEHGWDFPWRWIILFSGWFSFALFSATLYTSGECQIGLFFVSLLMEHLINMVCRSLLCHLSS